MCAPEYPRVPPCACVALSTRVYPRVPACARVCLGRRRRRSPVAVCYGEDEEEALAGPHVLLAHRTELLLPRRVEDYNTTAT